MTSWGKVIGIGCLVWLVPFIVAFMVFPIHASNRPLFESIMAVAVTGSAVGFGIWYLKNITRDIVIEAVKLGILWFVISVLIDAPLMLLGGPMKMTQGQYLSDIGVTYLCIPIVTWGLGYAFAKQK